MYKCSIKIFSPPTQTDLKYLAYGPGFWESLPLGLTLWPRLLLSASAASNWPQPPTSHSHLAEHLLYPPPEYTRQTPGNSLCCSMSSTPRRNGRGFIQQSGQAPLASAPLFPRLAANADKMAPVLFRRQMGTEAGAHSTLGERSPAHLLQRSTQ